MDIPNSVERRTQELGEALYEIAESSSGQSGLIQSVEDRLMNWTMERPRLKAPLFRLVDVLPAIDSSSEVVEHFSEYFREYDEGNLPATVRWMLSASRSPFMPSSLITPVIRRSVRRLARRFIAGETPGEVQSNVESLCKKGVGVSVDRLGEEVVSEKEADRYRDGYLELLSDLE
ncbi:MAG: hypothetical protein ABEJ65_00085, partial [bacterium]